jgi:pimeloyl-ACP methyl ester carboxylesterase
MSNVLKLGLAALALYVLIAFVAWLGQRRLMYFPNAARVSPTAAGLNGINEQVLPTPDGAELIVWRARARDQRPTLLYFHGNAGSLVNRAQRFAGYRASGFGLLAMSYRSYGGSTGSPSEEANMRDARQVYDVLLGDGVTPENIVLYGESLGSGVAVALAVEKRVGAVVLDAPYTSIVDVAARRYFWLPVRPLLADRYESGKRIKSVTAPVLILHGARDNVIPLEMGRKLHALANEPKRLIIFDDGSHADLDQHGAIERVTRWLDETLRAGER